jgi:hypothetical protein
MQGIPLDNDRNNNAGIIAGMRGGRGNYDYNERERWRGLYDIVIPFP